MGGRAVTMPQAQFFHNIGCANAAAQLRPHPVIAPSAGALPSEVSRFPRCPMARSIRRTTGPVAAGTSAGYDLRGCAKYPSLTEKTAASRTQGRVLHPLQLV